MTLFEIKVIFIFLYFIFAASPYFYIGNEKERKKASVPTKAESLIEIDERRYPISPVSIGRVGLGKVPGPKLRLWDDSHFKIEMFLNEFDAKVDKKLFISGYFGTSILSLSLLLYLGLIYNLLLFLIIAPLWCIFFLFYLSPKIANKLAKEKDEDLKDLAQFVISDLVNYFKENNLDPKQYPLRLRHNDYEGLIYVKEEKRFLIGKEYIAYLNLED